jgi:hypothetical protein
MDKKGWCRHLPEPGNSTSAPPAHFASLAIAASLDIESASNPGSSEGSLVGLAGDIDSLEVIAWNVEDT